jgi:elongation factor P
MASIDVNDIRGGNKVEIDRDPYVVVSAQFVKPGKGQAFTKAKLRHLLSGRVLERTFRSGEKLQIADVEERKMRLLYTEMEDAIFMDDNTFDQFTVPKDTIGENIKWLKDDTLYDLVFYNGEIVGVAPPTFMDLQITQTDPGLRGDTASGRVMKPATLESGAQVQVPIFIEQDERIKVDTRTAEYVSRT